jgi:hypothetical protein
LLSIICPNILREWQEKLKALKVAEDGAELPLEDVVEYQAEEQVSSTNDMPSGSNDVPMEVLQENPSKINEQSNESSVLVEQFHSEKFV